MLACLAILLGGLPTPVRNAQAADVGGWEARLWSMLQQDRASAGLPGFVQNPALMGLARGNIHHTCGLSVKGRAQDMAERNYFSHYIPPCNQQVYPAMVGAGVNYSGNPAAAENIEWSLGSGDPAGKANADFLASAEHRHNMMGPFNVAGVGAWQATNGKVYFVELFAMSTGFPGRRRPGRPGHHRPPRHPPPWRSARGRPCRSGGAGAPNRPRTLPEQAVSWRWRPRSTAISRRS